MDEPPRISDFPEGFTHDSLQNLPVSVVISDPALDDNPVVYVNDAFVRTTGYAVDEAIGRNCRFLQGPNTDPVDRQHLREAVEARQEIALDILNYRKDGTEFHNRLLVTPVHAKGGDALYFLGLQHEIGAAKSYARRAAELDERLKELQHRVKNHLALIVALIRTQASEMDRRDAAGLLAKRVEAISLLYSKIDLDSDGSGKSVDLGDYVQRVSAAMQALSDTVAVQVDVATDDIEMELDDAARVGLLLSEVLTNALKHAFDEGEARSAAVQVSLRDGENGTVVLCVNDNGGGLGDNKWPDENSLGGQIILDLVRRLNGDLTVETASDGTRVTLIVPR
ncbi:MAG: PAS domain-containing protein [Oceanicaulis sp.]